MSCHLFLMVRIQNRDESALSVQKVLTQYGCYVRMRLGLHDEEIGNTCTPSGVLILQLNCEKEHAESISKELNAISGVKSLLIDFN